MVKNEEMHYMDSDDQDEIGGGMKPDDKWVLRYFSIVCTHIYMWNIHK